MEGQISALEFDRLGMLLEPADPSKQHAGLSSSVPAFSGSNHANISVRHKFARLFAVINDLAMKFHDFHVARDRLGSRLGPVSPQGLAWPKDMLYRYSET